MKTVSNHIISRLILLIIFSTLGSSLFGQVKIWQFDKRSAIKTQGVYSVFESTEKVSDGSNEVKMIVPAVLGGINLGLSFLNTTLTNVTTRDEKQYSAQFESVNEVNLKPNTESKFRLQSYYVSRKFNQSVPLLTIDFKSNRSDSTLELTILESSKLDFSPVKLQRKHKMINSTYVITATAIVRESIDTTGKYVLKVIDLGKMDFNQIRIGSQCIYGCDKETASAEILLPNKTEKGMKIEILEVSLHFSATFINPVGTTQSGFNRFLVNHSDNNTAFIELLTTSREEESR